MNKINNHNLVSGLYFKGKQKNVICDVYVRAKQRNLPYYSKTLKPNRVLELIHTDVCGPITPASHNSNKYFVTFIDDFSRFVIVHIIKSKNEVFECLKNYVAKVHCFVAKE